MTQSLPPQLLLRHCPPHTEVEGPQALPQEFIHTLTHIPAHPDLPHAQPHVVKQFPEQLIKHQLEQSLVHDELAHDVAQLSSQLEPHE